MTFIEEKLQRAYDNSSPAEVTINSTNGPVTVKDNATPTNGTLLSVTNNSGTSDYLTVDKNRTKIGGYIKNNAVSSLSTFVATKWIADTNGSIDDNDWNDITWSPDLKRFVAVASNGTNRIYYSDDGITWTTPTTIPANSASSWRKVRWGAGSANKFIIIGSTDTNRILTSVDGDTWVTVTLPAEVTSQDWYSIARSEELDRFVVLPNSSSSTGMYSSDGISWTTMTVTGATFWYDVDWSPKLNLFAAVNGSLTDRIMTSSDGITWATKTASSQDLWFTMKWSPCLELFLAGATNGKIMKSANGDNDWTEVIDTAENFRNCVSIDELNVFIFCSASNQFVYSTNGDIWETTDQPNTGSFFAIGWSPYLGRAIALTTDPGITTPFRTIKDINVDLATQPGGNNTTIQFNNSSSIDGDDSLTWDTSNKTMNINGNLEHGFTDTYTTLQQLSDADIDAPVDIVIKHGLAFLCCRDNDKIVVVDIKDPTSMNIISTYSEAGVMDYPIYLELYGDYLIVANGISFDNIIVLDISDVYNITLVKTFKDDDYFEDSISGIKVYKNYLYVATSGTNDSIIVIDITDINRMYVLSTFTNAAMVDPKGPIEIVDDYMYIFSTGNGSNNFLIIDVSDPSALSLTGTLNNSQFRSNFGIIYRDNYIYCGSSTNDGTQDYFHIIDVSDKTAPSLTGSVQRNDIRTAKFVLVGNYAFIGSTSSSPALNRIDVSDPANPTLFTYSPSLGSLSGNVQNMVMYKNIIYVAHFSTNHYLTAIDVGGVTTSALISGNTYVDELYVSGETSFKKSVKFENFLTNGSTILSDSSVTTLDITAQQNLKTNNKVILGDTNSSKEIIIKGNDGLISMNSDTVIMGNLLNPILKLGSSPSVSWSSVSVSGSWNSVIWNEENDFLMAVGYNSGSSNGIYSTNDGASWPTFTPGDNTQNITDLVWIPRHNVTVAVAGNGGSSSNAQRIFYSKYSVTPTNGWNDYAYPLGGTPDFSAIEWSPELDIIIATLTTGQVSITTNIEVNHWIEYTLAETGTNLNDIVWSSETGLFVTVASTGTNRIQTSPDGKTWTSYNVGAHAYTCIAWAPQLGLFVACSNPMTAVATSSDGVTWEVITSNLPSNNIDCIAWSKDKYLFAAAGPTANVYLSPDGLNWTENSTTDSNFKGIVWAGGPINRFFTCSSNGSVERTDAVSASGTYNLTFPKSQGSNGNVLVNDGSGNLTWGVPGLTLDDVYTNTTPFELTLNSTQKGLIIKDNATPIDEPLFRVTNNLGGKDNIRIDDTQVTINNEVEITSDLVMKDFKRYNQITTIGSFSNATHPETEQWGKVVWAGYPINKFIAVNWATDTTNSSTYSDDGSTWITVADSDVSAAFEIIWIKELGKVFAVGTGNDISYTTTGTSWTNTSVTGAGSTTWESIAWAPEINTMVVVGRSGSDEHVASSTDGGITWTERTATTTNQTWYGVAWSGKLGLFVAVGGGGTDYCMFSSDGETWSDTGVSISSNNWFDITWSDELEMFIACTTNNIAYSYDGKTFTDVSVSGSFYFVEWIRELGVFFMARSNLDRVTLSPDGLNWTEYTSKLPNSNWWRSATWSQPLGRLIIGSSTSSVNSMAYIDIADNTNNLRLPLAEGAEGQVMKKTSTRGALEWEDANQLPSYTVAGVPSASPAGRIIYVADETGGATLAFSDGTNWRRVTDNAVIS